MSLHNGTITATSLGLKLGSVFTIAIPLVHKTTGELATYITLATLPAAIELAKATKPPFQNVLVVDDTPSNRKMLCRLLRNAGCNTTEAADGQEFVDIMTSFGPDRVPFDLVILDYEMPVLNGPKAIQRLRDLGFTTIVFGMSGNVLPSDVAYFKECGVDDAFPKPCVLSAIMQSYQKISNELLTKSSLSISTDNLSANIVYCSA